MANSPIAGHIRCGFINYKLQFQHQEENNNGKYQRNSRHTHNTSTSQWRLVCGFHCVGIASQPAASKHTHRHRRTCRQMDTTTTARSCSSKTEASLHCSSVVVTAWCLLSLSSLHLYISFSFNLSTYQLTTAFHDN